MKSSKKKNDSIRNNIDIEENKKDNKNIYVSNPKKRKKNNTKRTKGTNISNINPSTNNLNNYNKSVSQLKLTKKCRNECRKL